MRSRLFAPSLVVTGALWLAAGPVLAQQRDGSRAYPPDLPGAKVEVYKTLGDVKLNIYRYAPADLQPGERRPAIVFFFGGGWTSGSPGQFQQHCQYLASRGMVALTADYRVASRHGVKAVDCVRDAKSAVRWVRKESQRLGIDPERIAAGGGSAGGHLAAACGVISGLDDSSDDLAISSRPNALVLFNPALVLTELEEPSAEPKVKKKSRGDLRSRMGVEPKVLSPFHHVAAGAPPTLILHGQADTTVPYRTAAMFRDAMQKAGNRCELEGYDGQPHGFFNYGRGENRYYEATVRRMDDFLVALGYLSARPPAAGPAR